MYTLPPFNGHVIVQQGSEGPNRRPRMHTLESPMSHARSSYERKLVQILKMSISKESSIHNLKALFIIFTIPAYICDSLDQIVEKNGPPAQNCRPLGQLKKCLRTRSLSVWTQIESVFNGKNIKRKPLTNTSQVTFILTLKFIISNKIMGSQGQN